MNIAVLGSGGREHALCYKLTKSKKIQNIFVYLETLEQAE